MNCEILRTLYIKSNGEVLCNDDAGEAVSLGWIGADAASPSILDVLEGPSYAHIRASLRAGRAPWADVCRRCAFLRPDEDFGVDRLMDRAIDKIQIESSLACALECPGCSNRAQMAARSGARHIEGAVVRRLLTDLDRAGFSVGWVEYCGQGEPLTNPRFPGLVDLVRGIMPATRQRLITNGNFDHARRVGRARLDEVIVSIDGADPDHYATYRVGGRLDRALQFCRDAVAAAAPHGGSVVWKYVLFAWNDGDAELLSAQELAAEIGVTTLLFVFTPSPGRSERFRPQNAYALPIRHPKVRSNAHPMLYRSTRAVTAAFAMARSSGPDDLLAFLDEATIYDERHITISGWIAAHRRPAALSFTLGDAGGRAVLGFDRPDVAAALPDYPRQSFGFWLSCPSPTPAVGTPAVGTPVVGARLTLEARDADGGSIGVVSATLDLARRGAETAA